MGGWGYNYVIECLPNMYEALSWCLLLKNKISRLQSMYIPKHMHKAYKLYII
jgi:hypothetical protein